MSVSRSQSTCQINRKILLWEIFFLSIRIEGVTSGRGYAHSEVGIAYLDIESVRNT